MTKRNKLLQVARAEIGSKEPTGDDKYIKWYNKKCGTKFAMNVSWCCIFVSWCAEQAGIAKIVKPFASCTAMTNWFKNQGLFKERGKYTPKPGDIVMYDWDKSGDSDHVGIVEKKVGDKITVIEGNYGDAVKRREIYFADVLIRGYCIPKFPTGDVNGDGKVNAQDAQVVLKAAVGKANLNATQKQNADVNLDGKVDARDAQEILKTAVGK